MSEDLHDCLDHAHAVKPFPSDPLAPPRFECQRCRSEFEVPGAKVDRSGRLVG